MSNQDFHPTSSTTVLKSRRGNLVCIVCKLKVRRFWRRSIYNYLLDKIVPSEHTPVTSFQINKCKYNLQCGSLLLLLPSHYLFSKIRKLLWFLSPPIRFCLKFHKNRSRNRFLFCSVFWLLWLNRTFVRFIHTVACKSSSCSLLYNSSWQIYILQCIYPFYCWQILEPFLVIGCHKYWYCDISDRYLGRIRIAKT